MNIEELSKSQIVLLTILVNFVTSVATGVLTVSLLDQAPPEVTQTVNHVVEQTIQTVAQTVPVKVTSTPSTPAPSDQDSVTAAIGADASRVVNIYAADAGTSTPSIAVGSYLMSARAVATVTLDALPKQVLIEFPDGTTVPASLSREGSGVSIYGFSNTAQLPKVASFSLANATSLALGDTALAIGSDGSASTGIVSRVSGSTIQTTLPDIGAGSGVVDLSGDLIGLAKGGTPGLLISANVITELLAATTTAATTTAASS